MSRRFSCRTCAHYGCCDDLHHCGGLSWTSAYVACASCGREVYFENAEKINGRDYCEDCATKVKEDEEEEA